MESTDQSCLNRFLTRAEWDEQALNERHLELLQSDPSMRYHDRGVIALDNVLIDHDGKHIEDAGWFWDHAEERHKIAHDYLFANYVCPNGKQNARGESRGYVGDLKTNRKLEVRGQSIKVDGFAATIEPSARKELRRHSLV